MLGVDPSPAPAFIIAGFELVTAAVSATDCKSDDCNNPRLCRFARQKRRIHRSERR